MPSQGPDHVFTSPSVVTSPSPSYAIFTEAARRAPHQENPSSPPLITPASNPELLASSTMAYQRANPTSFVPPRMRHLEVEIRHFIVCAVANSRPTPHHEDWAIATIEPLPSNPLNFLDVRGVLDDFFADVAHVQVRAIQRTHLGQALVQFVRTYDRDRLMLNGPH